VLYAGSESTLEFSFGAVFTSIRTIPLQAPPDSVLKVADLLPTSSGRLWITDVRGSAVQVYSQEGRRLGTLDRELTGLRRPVSLAALHGRWVAVLDGYTPRVAILDDLGGVIRRFPLPEVDRPAQICNLGDRVLAVVGSGWGPGSGKLVHLYNLWGEYLESLLGEPRGGLGHSRPFAAAAGHAVYLSHNRSDSFAIYDVKARDVLAFPNQGAGRGPRLVRESGLRGDLSGLFATSCGPLLAVYALGSDETNYLYDAYALSGTPIALGLHARERVVGVEGPFFYSVASLSEGGVRLRVWKLKVTGESLGR
jgi:hypothetical protein